MVLLGAVENKEESGWETGTDVVVLMLVIRLVQRAMESW